MTDFLRKFLKLILIIIVIIIPFSLILVGLFYISQKLYFKYRDNQEEKLNEAKQLEEN